MTTSTPLAPTDVREEAGNGPGDPPAREVLVGVDGSEVGLAAVRWAAQEAARRNAPLRILHAAPYLGRRGTTAAPSPELHRARRITAQAYTLALHTAPGVHDLHGDRARRRHGLAAACGGGRAARRPRQLGDGGRRRDGARHGRDAGGRPLAACRSSSCRAVGTASPPAGPPSRSSASATVRTTRRSPIFAATSAERFGVPLSVLQTRPARRKAPDSWVDDPAEWEARYPGLEVRRTDLPAARAEQVLGATCPSPLLVISAGHGDLLHRFLDGPHRWLLRHSTSPMALVPRVRRPEQEPREEAVASG